MILKTRDLAPGKNKYNSNSGRSSSVKETRQQINEYSLVRIECTISVSFNGFTKVQLNSVHI